MDRTLKLEVTKLLGQRNFDQLVELCHKDKRYWRILRGILYEPDGNIAWPAIEAIAIVVKEWWRDGEEEKVREYIRNLFWSLNDESGGIGWNAPQTIAEIIAIIPELTAPYASMMVDRTIDEPALVADGLWGIGRLGKQAASAVEFFKKSIFAVFESEDSQKLGLTAWAMGEVGFRPALPYLENLKDRNDPIRIYISGKFEEKPLGVWALEAVDKIESMQRPV